MKNTMIAVLVGLAVFAGIMVWGFKTSRDVSCIGKEIFQTVEEYSEFKDAISAEEITIREIAVLASEPPIIVHFEIRVPVEYDFPYGERDTVSRTGNVVVPALIIGVIIGIMACLILDIGQENTSGSIDDRRQRK